MKPSLFRCFNKREFMSYVRTRGKIHISKDKNYITNGRIMFPTDAIMNIGIDIHEITSGCEILVLTEDLLDSIYKDRVQPVWVEYSYVGTFIMDVENEAYDSDICMFVNSDSQEMIYVALNSLKAAKFLREGKGVRLYPDELTVKAKPRARLKPVYFQDTDFQIVFSQYGEGALNQAERLSHNIFYYSCRRSHPKASEVLEAAKYLHSSLASDDDREYLNVMLAECRLKIAEMEQEKLAGDAAPASIKPITRAIAEESNANRRT